MGDGIADGNETDGIVEGETDVLDNSTKNRERQTVLLIPYLWLVILFSFD